MSYLELSDEVMRFMLYSNPQMQAKMLLPHLLKEAGYYVDNKEPAPAEAEQKYNQEFIEKFAIKISDWLNDPQNHISEEERNALLSQLVLQIVNLETKIFSGKVSDGLEAGTAEALEKNSPLSRALQQYLSPSIRAAVARQIQEIVEPLIKRYQISAQIHKVTQDIKINQESRRVLKVEVANKSQGVSEDISAALQNLRPGIFARNFTRWGKEAEDLYQQMLIAESEGKHGQSMQLMQQIMNVYDDAQRDITGAEKLFYQKSVAKMQDINTLMTGSLKDVLRAKQKLKELDKVIGEQKAKQIQLEAKEVALPAVKSRRDSAAAASDLGHASYLRQALSGGAPSKVTIKKEKKGVHWKDEKEGGQLEAETVFNKDEPPIAVTQASSSYEKETQSSAQAPQQTNKGRRP